ncbi:MAG: tyrosine-type recombinase/integrase [Gemmatimonadales bacterium]
MSHATKRWSYSTGERGRNRVRVFEHPVTGLLFLEHYAEDRRQRIALGHRDRERAKAKAEEVSVGLRNEEFVSRAPATLQTLFDIYVREVTPQKSGSSQSHDRRAVALFLECWGSSKIVGDLTRREWDGFIQWRRQRGDRRPGKKSKGRPIGNRVIIQNLKFLQAVLNWAVYAGDGTGRYLLEKNPFKGMPYPKEGPVSRPVLPHDHYTAMRDAAKELGAEYELAIVLAHETGHRIGSILRVRWSDIDLDRSMVRWRGENDKVGHEHSTPLTSTAADALRAYRKLQARIGDGWVFPSPEAPEVPVSRHLARTWWRRLQDRAGVPKRPGLGWHSLRRKFATELRQAPLRDLVDLGGWKSAQVVTRCYQGADHESQLLALAARRNTTALAV